MIWQDKGYLLSLNKYNENSAITDFYTENHGKISGILFGATSKKIKNYLFVGNRFHLNFNPKENGRIGYFKIEIDKLYTPFYLEDKKKLFCIIHAINLIKILTAYNQENIKIYNLIKNFFKILNNDEWILNFIYWELELYKIIGYDIDFNDYVKNITDNGEEKFIIESTNKIIPKFLINKKNLPIDNDDILKGFKIVGDYLDKTILKPNNINFPLSRIEFLNLIK